jgi:hypothetical protein
LQLGVGRIAVLIDGRPQLGRWKKLLGSLLRDLFDFEEELSRGSAALKSPFDDGGRSRLKTYGRHVMAEINSSAQRNWRLAEELSLD